MLEHPHPEVTDERPLVAATMFGVTTPAVQKAQAYLEERGYEVLVFHATGTGGKCMEALVNGGFISGVLDLTTTEWCDEIVGGVLAAGPDRCSAAALNGVPTVISVGALDMVNFGPWDTVPEQFKGRNLYKHNPTVTLMRTTVDENRQVAEAIASKVNLSTGPCVCWLPLKGSVDDRRRRPAVLWSGRGRDAVRHAEGVHLSPGCPDHRNGCPYQRRRIACAAAQKLIDLMNGDVSA